MAFIYERNQFIDGDVLRAADLNAEIGDYAGEMNGHLDRDNFGAFLLTHDKVAVDVWHRLLWEETSTPQTLSRAAGDGLDQVWQTVLSGSLTVEDGGLRLRAQVNTDRTGGTDIGFDIGIRVDGDVVCRSGTQPTDALNSTGVRATIAVGPGTKTVELVARIGPGSNGTASDVDITHACLFAHQPRR